MSIASRSANRRRRDKRSTRQLLTHIAEQLNHIEQKVSKLMATDQEVLDSVNTLKTDLEAKVAEAVAELKKLEGEVSNPAALDNIKSIVDGLDTSVKAAVVPST